MNKIISLLFALLAAVNVTGQPAYDYSTIQQERLNRGVVCLRDGDSTVISWRLLKEDASDVAFNIFTNGKKLNRKPITGATFMKVKSGKGDITYTVCTTNQKPKDIDGNAFTFNAKANSNLYLTIPLDRPEPGITPDGRRHTYSANDASVGDVDGDGEYEIILKWDPSNSHDNSQEGFTGNVYLDCYKLGKTMSKEGTNRLWRIDLGRNIRAGAHYTQFLVYDFDGDGKSELICKTADGTTDGTGIIIGNGDADYRTDGDISFKIDGKQTGTRHSQGRILEGPEYLTIFSCEDGKALCTVDYAPSRNIVSNWGDNYGNRQDRFLACVAYLDGKHPSAVMCRGYYTQTYLAAWDWDGKQLTQHWFFDSVKTDSINRAQNPDSRPLPYSGQGNHNLRVGDIDGDGCDEITYGSMAVDHDGTGLYTLDMGHGDAIHQYAFYPDSTQLQIWNVHENKRDGSELRDARTGRIIFQLPSNMDVGRGMAADIDPTIPGLEMWSASQSGFYDVTGKHYDTPNYLPQNSAVWWDGDLLRELLDKNSVIKYDWKSRKCNTMIEFEGCSFNNGTKQNPCLSADILGDWREEVIVRSKDSSELRIYVSTHPTSYRFPCWMQDIPYRLSVATENVGYNQPPEPATYFGADMKLP